MIFGKKMYLADKNVMNIFINLFIKFITKKHQKYWSQNIPIQILNHLKRLKLKFKMNISQRYHGNNHFCSRITAVDGTIWYNNGITIGNNSVEEGHLSTMNQEEFENLQWKNTCIAIYV